MHTGKSMKKIKIIIADDHPSFREGLSRLLGDEEEFEIIAVTCNDGETVEKVKELEPYIAIIDVAMPEVSGLAAAEEIKKCCPNTEVIMISAYDYESYLIASLKLGAAAYLLKDTPIDDIISAIHLVYKGEAIFDRRLISEIIGKNHPTNGNHLLGKNILNPRELEVLKLVSKGLVNRDIAERLFLSERTVQTHLTNIFHKLNVSSRTEAVLRALKKGWLLESDLP